MEKHIVRFDGIKYSAVNAFTGKVDKISTDEDEIYDYVDNFSRKEVQSPVRMRSKDYK